LATVRWEQSGRDDEDDAGVAAANDGWNYGYNYPYPRYGYAPQAICGYAPGYSAGPYCDYAPEYGASVGIGPVGIGIAPAWGW
jgi:hypothetical protein